MLSDREDVSGVPLLYANKINRKDETSEYKRNNYLKMTTIKAFIDVSIMQKKF